MDHRQKPGTPGDILKHHGVKGMKWGVRKDRESGGDQTPEQPKEAADRNAQTKAYISAAAKIQAEPVSPEQQEANLRKHREDFFKKFEPSEAEESSESKSPPPKLPERPKDPGALAKAQEKWNGLTPDQKQTVVVLGVYGAVGAGLLGYSLYARRHSLPMSTFMDMSGADAGPGQKIGVGRFLERINKSQNLAMKTENFFRPEAFARPEFELKPGHVFRRISSAAESTFGQATYCSENVDDFNRYANVLGVGGPIRHEVTFKATKGIKVPALTDVLETVKETMGGGDIPEADVLRRYKDISHDQWKSPRAKKLITALQSKGYGAVVDEMDAGVFSERPLVLFSRDVTPKRSRALKRGDLQKAADALKELPKPPGRVTAASLPKPSAPNLAPVAPRNINELFNEVFAAAAAAA